MNATCPFDKSHVVPADKLKTHIEKCKSPQKANFERCRYNPDHWINFSKIQQHEKQCAEEQASINSQISASDDSVLQEMCNAISDTKLYGIEQQLRQMREEEQRNAKQKNKMKKKKVHDQIQINFYKEPSFRDWMLDKKYLQQEDGNQDQYVEEDDQFYL